MTPFSAYARKFLVAVAAALAILATALSDGQVTATEWITVAIAAINALGVYYTPNEPMNNMEGK